MKRGVPESITSPSSSSTLSKKRQMEEKTIELPEELWSAIFSHLPLNNFHRIAQVNKQSLHLIQLLSQQFIQFYFSSAKTHPDFKDNAVKLLTKEYKNYQSSFYRIPFHVIFTALNGELDPLQQILSSPNASEWDKYDLLQYAAKNGHVILINLLLPKLTKLMRFSTSAVYYTVLIFAAEYGHYHIVNMLLANAPDNITDDHKINLLFYAIRDKQDNTIDLLLKTSLGISPSFLGSQLKEWVQEAKEEHVILLKKAVVISIEDESWALKYTAERNYLDIVNLCLKKATIITNDDKAWALIKAVAEDEGWVLKYAAEKNYLVIVNLCLKKATQITNDDKGWALVNAAKQGHLNIVKTLLRNTTISSDFKKMAILGAKSKHYDDIATIIESHLVLPPPVMTFAFKQPPSSSLSSSSSESSEENTDHNKKSSSFSCS